MKKPTFQPLLLLCGGLDPSAGAGLAVDLRAAQTLNVRHSPVVTGLALQTDKRFIELRPMGSEDIIGQVNAVIEQPIGAVKIGALGCLQPWANLLKTFTEMEIPVVVDPVIRSTSGGLLVADTSETALRRFYKEVIAPKATLITANLPEAMFLLGGEDHEFISPRAVAQRLSRLLGTNVLLKGGHGEGEITDILSTDKGLKLFHHPRIAKKNVRGTGCALATAIAVHLMNKKNLSFACSKGITQVQGWIEDSTEVVAGIHHLLV